MIRAQVVQRVGSRRVVLTHHVDVPRPGWFVRIIAGPNVVNVDTAHPSRAAAMRNARALCRSGR